MEELAFSHTFKLINKDELFYNKSLFPKGGLSFPVGPVNIIIELSAFGGWGLSGGVTVGVDYDGGLDGLLANVGQLHDFLAERSAWTRGLLIGGASRCGR